MCAAVYSPAKCLGLLCFYVPVFALYSFSLSPLYSGCYFKFLVLSVNHNVTSHSHLHHPARFFTTNTLNEDTGTVFVKIMFKIKRLMEDLRTFLWRKCMGFGVSDCSSKCFAYFLFPCCFWIAKTPS